MPKQIDKLIPNEKSKSYQQCFLALANVKKAKQNVLPRSNAFQKKKWWNLFHCKECLICIIINTKSDIFLQNEAYSFNFFSKIEKELDWDSNYDDFLHEKVEVELVPHYFCRKSKGGTSSATIAFSKKQKWNLFLHMQKNMFSDHIQVKYSFLY